MAKAVSKAYIMESKLNTRQYINQYESQIFNPERLLLYKGSRLIMDELSIIELNGSCEIGAGCLDDYGRSSIFRMDRNSKLIINGNNVRFFYGADVCLFQNASFTVGNRTRIEADSRILCGKKITIGDDCIVGPQVTFVDSDFQIISAGQEKPKLGEKGITVGNHVFIGANAVILKDVSIGDGAVIAAGAVVTANVAPNTEVAGSPARVIKEYVEWR